jgi:hypothetical protein
MKMKIASYSFALLTLSVLVVSAMGQRFDTQNQPLPDPVPVPAQPPIGLGPPAAVPSGAAYTVYPRNPGQAPLDVLPVPQPAGYGHATSYFSPHGFGGTMSADERNLANTVETLVRSLGEAKTEDIKDDIKAKLGKALGGQFELRQKRHESEIAELESQVKKLRDLVQKRQENRREIIAKRLDQLLRDAQGLGW